MPSAVSAELPGQTAGGHREDSGEGEQQREVHQQPAGPPDPGVPQRSGQTQRGNGSCFPLDVFSCLLFCFSTQTCALHQAKERHQQASGGVTDRTRMLAEVSEHIFAR